MFSGLISGGIVLIFGDGFGTTSEGGSETDVGDSGGEVDAAEESVGTAAIGVACSVLVCLSTPLLML